VPSSPPGAPAAPPLPFQNIASRVSQRAGTAGAPSRRRGRTAPPSARRRRLGKVMRRLANGFLGRGEPNRGPHRRDNQGPGSTSGGQTPSTGREHDHLGALQPRLQQSPNEYRGCSASAPPRSARRDRPPCRPAPRRAGRANPRGWSPSTGSAACTSDRAVANASPSSPAHTGRPSISSVLARFSAAAISPASMVAAAPRPRRRCAAPAPAGLDPREQRRGGSDQWPIAALLRLRLIHRWRSPSGRRRGGAAQAGEFQRRARRDRRPAPGRRRPTGASTPPAMARCKLFGDRHRQQAQEHAGGVAASGSPALSSATTP